jgi:uncharacterized membrane protein
MSRPAFAVAVPALLAAIGAFLFGYAVALGFSGEGCRFRAGQPPAWSTVAETVIFQAVAMAILGALVLGLVRVLALRSPPSAGRDPWLRALVWSAVVAIALLTALVLIEQIGCGTVAWRTVVSVLREATFLAAIVAAVLALANYVRGLRKA